MALTDTFFGLPRLSMAIVAVMVVAFSWLFIMAVTEHELEDMRWVVLATVAGFFLVDLFYVHPEVWENVPSLFYWVVKPFWVGVPMFLALFLLVDRLDVPTVPALVLAGVAGIVVLQLYYTVIPIPIVEGEAIQIGLIGNLTGGVHVHGSALIASLAAVFLAMEIF